MYCVYFKKKYPNHLVLFLRFNFKDFSFQCFYHVCTFWRVNGHLCGLDLRGLVSGASKRFTSLTQQRPVHTQRAGKAARKKAAFSFERFFQLLLLYTMGKNWNVKMSSVLLLTPLRTWLNVPYIIHAVTISCLVHQLLCCCRVVVPLRVPASVRSSIYVLKVPVKILIISYNLPTYTKWHNLLQAPHSITYDSSFQFKQQFLSQLISSMFSNTVKEN